MSASALRDRLITALEDLKGQEILSLDVSKLTSITDYMVLVTGTSNRHVKALVDEVIIAAKDHGEPPLGVEGRETGEWVLLDVGDVVVHVMQKEAREFYDLERMWSELPADSGSTQH
ncbi:MAG: ribosome silencing factor [Pseudomonadota bacterium]